MSQSKQVKNASREENPPWATVNHGIPVAYRLPPPYIPHVGVVWVRLG